MKKANEYRAAGQPDQAAGVLERALRIEPRNYFVWSALGQAYLAQKNYAQAESVAQKSTALARGNYYVALENWKTIQAARMARGDAAGAALAGAQVASLQAQISGGTP
nr:tetratricopeptide repeat protein [Solimonas marina]